MPNTLTRRVKFAELRLEQDRGGWLRATVTLEWRGRIHTGKGEGDLTEEGSLRCCGQAAVGALASILRDVAGLELLDIEKLTALGTPAVVVALAIHEKDDTRYSVGLCTIKHQDLGDAAVRAVLNGANRYLSLALGARG